ncbi:MAG: hypothetical protein KJO82_03635, partial [Gammaproteobacteria bacterium]|nr:hypothetical protein [Gammaproteobacteria bacterium]
MHRSQQKHWLLACWLVASVLAVGCGDNKAANLPADRPAGLKVTLNVPGNLENKDIAEASGLAASRRRDDLLWTHNDSGSRARIYALGLAGESRGRAKIKGADNKDWEDMAAFVLDGVPYLLIADVGDNAAKRDTVMLYIVEEPDLEADDKPELKPAWEIELRYPGGPRDVEAVAVDSENAQVLLLAKRTIPAELYAVPLRPDTDAVVTAEFLGRLDTLPQPSRRDIDFAPKTDDWFWQPTGMDIASDGSALAIVTYHPAVYLYQRDGDWLNTVQQPPLRLTLRRTPKPESVAFG